MEHSGEIIEVLGMADIELFDGDIDRGEAEHGYFVDFEACGPLAPASGEERFAGVLDIEAVRLYEFALFAKLGLEVFDALERAFLGDADVEVDGATRALTLC